MPDHPPADPGLMSRKILDTVPLGTVLLDARDDVVWANRGWNELCLSVAGTSSGTVGASYAAQLAQALRLNGADIERVLGGIDDVREGRRENCVVDCAIRAGSEPVWLCVTAMPFESGEQRFILLTHQEITERKRRERSLQRFRDAFDHAAEVVIIADADGMIQYVNRAFSDVHGLSSEDAIGRPIWNTVTERDQPLTDAIMPALRAGKPWREERPIKSDEQRLTWEARSVAPVISEDGSVEHLIVIGRDVTEQRAYLDQLTRHAYYDALTGLPNRTLFLDRLAHAHLRVQRSRQPLAVMFLDLNGFKRVNDNFGHGVGDQVLSEVAQRLIRALRASDTVARTGGDEFVFLLEELSTEKDAVTVARRLIDDIANPLHIAETSISISGSIGIAFDTPAISEPATLLDLADIALYHAKAKREDRFTVYHEHMTMPRGDRFERRGFPFSG